MVCMFAMTIEDGKIKMVEREGLKKKKKKKEYRRLYAKCCVHTFCSECVVRGRGGWVLVVEAFRRHAHQPRKEELGKPSNKKTVAESP